MADPSNPINRAFELIAVLRTIVLAERQRAESAPLHKRNFELGILSPEKHRSRTDAEREIIATFNAIEMLLDHFNIMHMAASFESAALARIGNAVGVARSAVEKRKPSGQRWPAKLVRDAKAYESLEGISDLLALASDDKAAFDAIKKVRNELSHGVPIKDIPSITGEDARDTLVEALERLKL